METTYEPCDIYFTKGTSLLSRAIRWATREKGEARTHANHVGAIVTHGPIESVSCIEALTKVRRHWLMGQYMGKNTQVQIWRPTNLTEEDKAVILRYLHAHVGDTYGYLKIGLHLLRKLTGRKKWLKASALEDYPICSYLVARAFAEAGKDFGVRAKRATPDDMHDFCTSNPDKWVPVRNWGRL